MSEVQPRPARGRSSARGGRGSYASRGPRKQTNGDGASSAIDTSAEQGELAELKKRYQSQLSMLKELFPDWTDADLVLAIEDSDGDLERTIEKISEGAVSQFSEVPKKAKDRSRSKVAKENLASTDGATSQRGGRGEAPRRGGDSVRGGRGRGTDRGRGGFSGGRGGRGGAPTTARGASSVPTTESAAWDTTPATAEPTENGQTSEPKAEKEEPEHHTKVGAAAGAVAGAAKKTWASMFSKPPPAPAVPKPAEKPTRAPEQPTHVPDEPPAHEVAQEPAVHAEELPIPPIADHAVEQPSIAADDTSKLTPDKIDAASPELTLTPSKDELTKENVEHLPDATSQQTPLTETNVSTVASSKDIGSAVATPLSTITHPTIGRPGIGGYATTALKATSSGQQRSASYQRRLMEQQEAVVMPGNHAVDRAAVQFGSLGLGASSDLDVDEDREEAETREQPPQHSPVAQPRAALPPAPRQSQTQADLQQQESVPTPKQAPGLPPVAHQQAQHSPHNPLAAQTLHSQGSQPNQRYDQFGQYGQAGVPSEAAAPPQKPYDPFGQQIPRQSSQYDYPGQSQAQQQPGAFSSAPSDYSSQYFTSEQRYQQYYGGYGQQSTPSQQEAGSAQQRTGSAFGAAPNDAAFAQQQQQHGQSRYNDAQNSGHNTPNPALGAQQAGGPGAQGQHMQQHAGQQGHTGGYPYNHPYYGSPYYANYMNQFGGYGQGGGYGSFGKGMYGQPQHYGMSPQASYDQHSSSPANVGAFGASSLHERSAGLSDYGRSAAGTTQSHSATAGTGGFGGFPDSFGRQQGYSNQSSYGQQQTGQAGSNEDSLKPFSDSKSGGPSPSALGAQPGRPGSATQNTPGQGGQSGHPQQSHQQGFGGYPGHLGGNSQYGGLGGLGHQGGASHQQSQYGNYGGFGGGYGGGNYNRGGWGGNYGQH